MTAMSLDHLADRINAVVETLFTFARNPRMNLRPGDINNTVREALESIREVYGYEYKIDGTRISIQPSGIQTRVAQPDSIKISPIMNIRKVFMMIISAD